MTICIYLGLWMCVHINLYRRKNKLVSGWFYLYLKYLPMINVAAFGSSYNHVYWYVMFYLLSYITVYFENETKMRKFLIFTSVCSGRGLVLLASAMNFLGGVHGLANLNGDSEVLVSYVLCQTVLEWLPTKAVKLQLLLVFNYYLKWSRRARVQILSSLIAFRIALIPLGKVWIQLFSLQLWVNSKTDWVLQPWWGN